MTRSHESEVDMRKSDPIRVAGSPSFAFAAGLLMSYEFQVGGQLYVIEAIAPLIILVFAKISVLPAQTQRLLLLGAVWLSAQLLSDLVNFVGWAEMGTASALIVFTLLDVAALSLVVGNSAAALRSAFLGYGIATIIRFIVEPTPFALYDPWKFGIGLAVSFVVISLASRYPRRVQYFVLAILASINLGLGFRSQAVILFVTLTALLMPRFRLSGVSRILSVVAVGVTLIVAQQSYSYLAASGTLGQAAQSKYVDQTGGSLGLLSGRGETIYALLAIRDSPIVGIGSDATDPGGIVATGAQIEARVGSSLALARTRDGVVPLHSHILGAWAESGLGSLPFWGLALAIIATAVTRSGNLDYRLRVIVIYGSLNSGWDILFSPLGSFGRFQVAIGLTAAVFGIVASRTASPREASAGTRGE